MLGERRMATESTSSLCAGRAAEGKCYPTRQRKEAAGLRVEQGVAARRQREVGTPRDVVGFSSHHPAGKEPAQPGASSTFTQRKPADSPNASCLMAFPTLISAWQSRVCTPGLLPGVRQRLIFRCSLWVPQGCCQLLPPAKPEQLK